MIRCKVLQNDEDQNILHLNSFEQTLWYQGPLLVRTPTFCVVSEHTAGGL